MAVPVEELTKDGKEITIRNTFLLLVLTVVCVGQVMTCTSVSTFWLIFI